MDAFGHRCFRTGGLPRFGAFALAILCGNVSVVHAQAGRIYWTDSNNGGTATARVHRADLDGSHPQRLVLPPSLSPRYLALDVSGGKMYWTDIGVINRANLDGTGVMTLITAGPCPMGIALDLPAGRVYWTDCVEGRIMRANLLDGSGVEQVIAGLSAPRAVALDLAHGKIYWTDSDSKKIQRSSLDGTNREDLVTGLFLQAIVLDADAGRMYWQDDRKIHRANLDGSSPTVIVENAGPSIGIALDRANRKLYWTEFEIKGIVRANLDGTAMETVVSGGMDTPWGLALAQTSEIITGADAGGGPHVRELTREPEGSLRELAGFFPYSSAFPGGVRVAAGDIDGDGRVDLITGAGPGGGPHVRALKRLPNGTIDEIAGFFAYDVNFPGGVSVAAGDVNGDGRADIITGAGPGGGPHVRVLGHLYGGAVEELCGFFACDPAFAGGVRVAAGDVDGDGRADIITGAGPGGGPHVRVLSCNDHAPDRELASFFAYAPSFAGGVYVAAGDVDGDGLADIITGADAGGGPHVRVFKRQSNGSLTEIVGFLAYAPAFAGGVRVAAADLNGDGRAEIITAAGPGGGPHVRSFTLTNDLVTELTGFLAYSPNFTGGVFVASETPVSPAVSMGFFGVTGHFVRFEGPYSQSGFTLNTTGGNWFSTRRTGFLDGAYIYFMRYAGDPTLTAEVRLTAAGSLFRFTSVDVFSTDTEIPYTITGLKDSSPVFTLTGTVPNPSGQIAPVINSNASATVDTLVIRLSNPANPCCANAVGIDRIGLRY